MAGQSSKKRSCGICFDLKPASSMFRSRLCKDHPPFCNDCISKHVASKLEQNVVRVNCPNPNCNVELRPKKLRPLLPKEVLVRWEAAILESSIASHQKIYCPFKDCSVLVVDDGDEGDVVTSSECPCCHRLFCAQCKVPWHADMNCEEFKESKIINDEKNLDRKLMKLARREKWSKCPKCSFYVQKVNGCEHMTCRCGCNFCYLCGKKWKHGHICKKSLST